MSAFVVWKKILKDCGVSVVATVIVNLCLCGIVKIILFCIMKCLYCLYVIGLSPKVCGVVSYSSF